MGQFELYAFLMRLRLTGDDRFLTSREVYQLYIVEVHCYYTGVWRSLNALWSSGMVESLIEDRGLQRTVRFRAKIPSGVQVSGMKREYNIYRRVEQKSGRSALVGDSKAGGGSLG